MTCNNFRDFNISISGSLKITEDIKKRYGNKKLFLYMKDVFEILMDDGYSLFRGQHDNWELIPSIDRFTKEQKVEIKKLVNDLAIKFPIQVAKTEGDIALSSKSHVQHFGVPTNLLDVSFNPWVAYYFMFLDYPDGTKTTKTFYALKPKVKDVKSLEQVPVDSNNPRIVAQEGAFINFNSDYILENDFDIFKLEINVSDDLESAEVFQKVLIKDQQRQLALIGYTNEKLFPDFNKLIEYRMDAINKMKTIENEI